MSEIDFTRDIACGRERIRELLLNREFLTRFLELRHPVTFEISVEAAEWSSTLDWVTSTEGIPGIFRRLVGDTVPIRLVIVSRGTAPDDDGSVHVDLEGKASGQLRSSLSLTSVGQHPARTAMAVRGQLDIAAGLLSGKASSMAREHLIVPILGQLTDLIEESCAEPPA
jgi:hypothetical protein